MTKPITIFCECVRGFGVCCVFTAECRQRTTERAVYFQPAPATPASAPCTLAITPLDRDVRQVRRSDSTIYIYRKYFISTKNIFHIYQKNILHLPISFYFVKVRIEFETLILADPNKNGVCDQEYIEVRWYV